MAISPLPTPPSRNNPSTFSALTDEFLGALPTFRSEANTLQTDVNAKQATASTAATTATTQAGTATTQAGIATTQAGIATTKATEAAASATTALNAPGTNATSTTSTVVGSGTKTLTIQTGKSIVVGMGIMIARTSAPSTTWMFGLCTYYNSGTGSLSISVASTGFAGSGTYTDWTVSLSATQVTAGSFASLTGNTFTAAQVYSDQQNSRAMFIDCGYAFADKGNSSTNTQTLNYTVGSHQKITATGNHTIATANWPPTGNLGVILLEAVNFGAYTVTWPTIYWVLPSGAVTTSVSTWLAAVTGRTAFQTSGTEFIRLISRDGGTTIYGGFAL